MSLVVIFGPAAVGKMTVAQHLAEIAEVAVFHNHMTIDLVLPFFDFGTAPYKRLVGEFRTRILEEAAGAGRSVAFTVCWGMDEPADREAIDRYAAIFAEKGAPTYYVELVAAQDIRLARNRTPHRLAHKPTKRDLDVSDERLRGMDARYRLNSRGDFFYPEAYLRLDNSEMALGEAAWRIKERFDLR